MEIKGSALTGYGSAGTKEDDFQRTVAPGSRPNGWGTGGLGTWEENYYYAPTYDADPTFLENVDGSEGVYEFRQEPKTYVNSRWRYYGISGYPTMCIAGPNSSVDTEYWLEPPIDVYYDFKFSEFVSGTDFLAPRASHYNSSGGLEYVGGQFGLAQQAAGLQVPEQPPYGDPAVSPHSLGFFNSKYYGLIDVWVSCDVYPPVNDLAHWFIQVDPNEGFSEGTYSYQELSVPMAEFMGIWWRCRLQVSSYGVFWKYWLRGTTEPENWMVWSAGTTSVTNVEDWGGGEICDPKLYNVLGWRELYGMGYSIYTPGHDWRVDGYSATVNWGYANADYALPDGDSYAIAWDPVTHESFSNTGTTHNQGNVWPVFSAGPTACHNANQSITSLKDWNAGEPGVPGIASVTVTGQVRVTQAGWPCTDVRPQGSVSVSIEQFSYGQTFPSYTSGGDSLSPVDAPHITGGTTMWSATCPYYHRDWNDYSTAEWVDFTFTTTLTNGQLQWGVRAANMWSLLVPYGKWCNGFMTVSWGSFAVNVRNVVYTLVDEAPAEPPEVGAEIRMDNILVTSGSGGPVPLATGKLG